jgi:hypothetical protein
MIINSEWEKFQGGPTQATQTRLHATIAPSFKIHLNANLHRQLGKPAAVHLLFNRQRDQIGLEPTSPRLPEAFPVKEHNNVYYISAAPFCRHFGIKIDATHKFIRPEVSSDGKLILNLSETVLVTRKKRRR